MARFLFEVANSLRVFSATLLPAFSTASSATSLAALAATFLPDFSNPSSAASFTTFPATFDVTPEVLLLMIFDTNVSQELRPNDKAANATSFIQ